jgi:hypothetical protein
VVYRKSGKMDVLNGKLTPNEAGVMSDIEITIRLPEELVKEAKALGVLSSEHIESLLRADIQAQLAAMAADPDIQREIRAIEAEFAGTELDGLDKDEL